MIEFTFEVNGQELRRTDRVNPAGDVVGQLWAVFEFDDWWEDTFPIARFMKSGVIYDVEVIDDRCLVPYQALAGEGKFYISVYALVDGGRKTTNKEVVEYTTSGLNLSVPPAPQEGTLWEKLYKSLYGGKQGQYLQKHSDNNFDFEFSDPPANATYLFDVAELQEKDLLNTTTGTVKETGDEAYPYSVEVAQIITYGSTNQTTGDLTSFLDVDLGIKYFKKAQWEPTTLGGCLDVLYVGNHVVVGYPHKLRDTIKFISVVGAVAESVVNLRQFSNLQTVEVLSTVKFPTAPTETNIEDVRKYLNGEANSKGRYIKKIYVRIEVPATKDVSVL